MTTKTTKMTVKETTNWLNTYFFGNSEEWEVLHEGAKSAIYAWLLDENVEVVITTDADDLTLITVNFYDNATCGTPYRTGEMFCTLIRLS